MSDNNPWGHYHAPSNGSIVGYCLDGSLWCASADLPDDPPVTYAWRKVEQTIDHGERLGDRAERRTRPGGGRVRRLLDALRPARSKPNGDARAAEPVTLETRPASGRPAELAAAHPAAQMQVSMARHDPASAGRHGRSRLFVPDAAFDADCQTLPISLRELADALNKCVAHIGKTARARAWKDFEKLPDSKFPSIPGHPPRPTEDEVRIGFVLREDHIVVTALIHPKGSPHPADPPWPTVPSGG